MDLPPLAAEEKVSDPGSGVGISAIFPFDLFGRGALCLSFSLLRKVVFRVNGRIRFLKRWVGIFLIENYI
jgi:hypothetical protein